MRACLRAATVVVAIVVAAAVGWWVLPALALVVCVTVAVERAIAHVESAELRATVDSYEAAIPERLRTVAAWGDIRSHPPVPAPPKLRPDQHWAAEPSGAIRRWVVISDRPSLVRRAQAATVAWLAAIERHPFWTELDPPSPGRHRAGGRPVVPAQHAPTAEASVTMPTGEFDLAVRKLTAEVYASVARGAR